VVHRNDAITIEEIEALGPVRIVVSPGPGTPAEAGISMEVIRHFAGKLPILGVCLGHQAIVEVFGGIVEGAGEIMHGKQSKMYHDSRGVFAGLPRPVLACRYHSLAARPSSMPACLEVTCFSVKGEAAAPPSSARADPTSMTTVHASGDESDEGVVRTEKDVIQGVRHVEHNIEGVQFHPESIATQGGMTMFRNFLLARGGTR